MIYNTLTKQLYSFSTYLHHRMCKNVDKYEIFKLFKSCVYKMLNRKLICTSYTQVKVILNKLRIKNIIVRNISYPHIHITYYDYYFYI